MGLSGILTIVSCSGGEGGTSDEGYGGDKSAVPLAGSGGTSGDPKQIQTGGSAGENDRPRASDGSGGARSGSDAGAGSAGPGPIDLGGGMGVTDWIGSCLEDEVVFGSTPSSDGKQCCGCLCADSRWSCSEDTCTDDNGQVRQLAPEAGFFEVEGGTYGVNGEKRVSPNHRMFYSFHPAGEASRSGSPADRPLLVFFNGGPGSPTTPFLFSLGTGPRTLDPRKTGNEEIAPNPDDFSRAFHLLYVDAPGTGFSYSRPLESGSTPEHFLDMRRDAAEFLKLVFLFLEKHPPLQGAQVGLVGESYGGTRATLMMDLLQNYPRLSEKEGEYHDQALYETVLAHFARTIPELDDAAPSLEQVRSQFGHQVLIQPALLGDLQMSADPEAAPCFGSLCASRLEHECVGNPERSQCDMEEGELELLVDETVARLTRVEILEQMLGVNPASIAWLRRCPESLLVPEAQLPFVVGRDLEPYPGALTWNDSTVTEMTVPTFLQARTFITHAGRDLVIDSMQIVSALASVLLPPSMAELRSDVPMGASRPGQLYFRLGEEETLIRFPHYEAGHIVSMAASAELYEDLLAWWEDE